MREDMAKVIVERPRHGSRYKKAAKGYRKRQRRLADDDPVSQDQPRREGMKRRGGATRELNEHLGPLRRFLQSRVGRPWSEVSAEIRARIDRSSAVQDHVLDHVKGYVVTRVQLIKGVPCFADGSYAEGVPLHRYPWRRFFYVCPRTGRLKRVRECARRRHFSFLASPVSAVSACILHGYREYFLCIGGVWKLATVAKFPRSASADVVSGPIVRKQHDMALRQDLSREEAVLAYGAAVYAVAVRPATREEIRRYCAK
jgi:hypothetical protein